MESTAKLLQPAPPDGVYGPLPDDPTVEDLVGHLKGEARDKELGVLKDLLLFEGPILLPDDISPSRETRMREFLALIANGHNDTEAARAIGYSRWVPYRWKKVYPGFMDAYTKACSVGVEVLVAEAKRRAMRGSDRLLEFLLCNLAPDQFKRNADVKVDVGVNVAERLQAGRKRTGGG